jgi:hypothetical protein
MSDRATTTDAPRHPSTVTLGIMLILTLLAVIALGWLWFDRYAPVHFNTSKDANIDDARAAARIVPVLWLGVFLIALLWVLTWIRARWKLTLLPTAIGIIGVLALVLAGRAVWQAADAHQPIQVLTYLCEADSARITDRGADIPDGCELAPGPEAATIGTDADPAMEQPNKDDITANSFPDMPRGAYDAVLTTTVPPDTATALLVVETGDTIQPVSRMEHQEDTRWSGTIVLHPNLQTYIVLAYPSPYTPVPDARITFTVKTCSGTSLADFDASACRPTSLDGPFIEEVPLAETEAGLPLTQSIDDDTMTLSSLEARTYTFAPSIRGGTLRAGRVDMLVIPADDPQESDRNVLDPGSGTAMGSFTVEVDEDTGEIGYIVYVFDDGPTVASAAALPAGMRP